MFFTAALSLLIFFNASAFAATTLQADRQTATEGFIGFSWDQSASDAEHAFLELSAHVGFTPNIRRYPLTHQTKVHISGLMDGIYYARLLDQTHAPISQPLRFEVKHRTLNTALILFSGGAFLFMFLISLIIYFTVLKPPITSLSQNSE